MEKKETQKRLILRYLRSGRSLTQLQALNMFNCMRLARVVHQLKKEGHPIKSEIISTLTHKHVAKYYIE